ncbi:hypothetical protein [Sphingobacterium sp.]|uniref:hypothetical protein n=1 Tax=Sphingobacterium sp. TaxID=341027 RepID=UPI002FD9CC0C
MAGGSFREIEPKNDTPVVWNVVNYIREWLVPAPKYGISPKYKPTPRHSDRIEVNCLHEDERQAQLNIWCYPPDWLPAVMLILDNALLPDGSYIEYTPKYSELKVGHFKITVHKHTHNGKK